MYKHYLIILTLFLSMGFMASAQIKSDKVPVVYTGPSADGDAKRDKGDLEGAIVSYTSEIKKIEVEVNRIVKLKDAYKKMSEFDKMNQTQDDGKKNYRPENSLRIRLDKISQGKNLGYVRVISDYDFQNDINLDKAHLVYIYKK